MQPLEGVKLIKDIEQKYDVMSIKYKGISVWPFLRLYLKDSVTNSRESKASASNIGIVLRSLFAYNPFRAFRKHDIWSFTACERRKKLGSKQVHRISGAFASEGLNLLMVEKPSAGMSHFPLREIEEKDIISEAWLLMTFHALEFFSRITTPNVENVDLLKRILADKHISFDYLRYVRMLNAQRKAMRMMTSFLPKPKAVFIECPYDTMGYLWALHEKGIKVVEMQHGSLNGNHLSYNAKAYEPKLNPDCICVFGEGEYKYLTEEKPEYAPDVRMTGMYFLERADQWFAKDVFEEDRKNFKEIVVVSGQPSWEEPMAEFIDTVAFNHKDLLFIYIPRRVRDDLLFTSENVRLANGVNIYEYLKWADVHITISSTTCMEAQYYHTPTIFYNFENIPATYFKDILREENWAVLVDAPQQFDDAYKSIHKSDIIYTEYYAHNHVERIMKVIEENLK